MTRNRYEIAKDVARLKEAGDWMYRSGHTAAEEAAKFAAAKARLKTDFTDDPELLIAVMADDDDAFERRVDELLKSLS